MSDDFEAIAASLGDEFAQDAQDKLTTIVVPCASTLGEIAELCEVVNKGGQDAVMVYLALGHKLLDKFIEACLSVGYCPDHDTFDDHDPQSPFPWEAKDG